MSDLREKRVELILQQLEELPTLPAVALRVLQVTSDDTSSVKDVVQLVGSDPVLAARILQLTRRADVALHNGGTGPLRDAPPSIERAVVMMGFEAVRRAVLAVSVFQTFATPRDGEGRAGLRSKFSREEFWTHCVAVACCAELLAELKPEPNRVPPPESVTAGAAGVTHRPAGARKPDSLKPQLKAEGPARAGEVREAAAGATAIPVSPSEAFLCGLLHDLGKVALDAVLPKSFSRVVEAADLLRGNIADLERTVIGLDHMVVGKRLAERWRLPAVIRDCVWLHGQQPQALPAAARNHRLVNLVTLADLVVREQHLGYSGNYAFPLSREVLLEAVGLTSHQLEAAVPHLVERIEARAQALGLGQASADELYQHALRKANRELGRVSSQLSAKGRKLAVRSRFFDALSHFQGGLRPDAPPQAVLQAIAQTAVGVLGVSAAAAFSLPPGQDYAETLLCNDKGEVIDTSLVDLPGMSRVTGPAAVSMGMPDLGALPVARAEDARGKAVEPAEGARTPVETPVLSEEEIAHLSGAVEGGEGPLGGAGSSAKPQAADSVGGFSQSSGRSGGEAGGRPESPLPGDGPVLPAGEGIEWLVGVLSPRLAHDRRFWICLEADGACIGGLLWGAPAGEARRLGPQAQELCALANGWSLALRAAQVREEARTLAEQLADANRRLHDAQSELLRSKAMLTVGEMAAGAAHEMNNPLAVISGRSQLLAQQLTDPKHKAMAHLIHEQSHRLSSIITELMDFARPEPPAPADCELADMVHRALHEAKMHNDPADRTIEVTMGDVPLVFVDERQVAAALAEVIDNAIHATDPSNGHVAVHAAYDACSARVVVSVTDDGCGMDENTARRAFDPFFSNKPAGRRRGLGLAKALRWIEASGGSIRLESRVGKGTRAVLLLPAASAAGSAADADVPQRRAL